MASVSISANGVTTSPYLYSTATISEKSRSGTSVVLNISIVSHLGSSSSYLGSGYTYTGTVTAYGITKSITLKSSGESWSGNANHTKTATMSITVPASANSITIGYKCTVSGYESNTVVGTNQSLALSKVLASVTSVTDFTDTTNPTMTFNNPSNFKLRPYISLWTSQSGGTQIGVTFSPVDIPQPTSSLVSPYAWELTGEQRNVIRNWMGNRTSAYALIGVGTYDNNNNWLGSSSKGATFTNVLEAPTFNNFTTTDTNSSTVAVTGDNSKIILGYSDLTITISGNNKATANKGATMSYYLINNVQYSYSDNFSVTLEKWDKPDVTVVAVDSRGISTSVTKILTLATYTPLEKGSSGIARDGNVSEETKLSYNGSMQKTLPNGNNNTLTVSYQYKKTNEDNYTTGTTNIDPTIDNEGNFSLEKYIVGDIATGFSINDSFNVQVNVADVLSSIQYNVTLNSGVPAIAIKGNNVAIHGVYDETLGGTQLNGDIYIDGEDINTKFGGALNYTTFILSSNQSIAKSSFVTINYSTTEREGEQFASISNGTITFSKSGSYLLILNTIYDTNNTGGRYHDAFFGGGAYAVSSTNGANGVRTALNSSAIVSFDASDTFYCRAYQTTSGNLNLIGGSRITIIKIR